MDNGQYGHHDPDLVPAQDVPHTLAPDPHHLGRHQVRVVVTVLAVEVRRELADAPVRER